MITAILSYRNCPAADAFVDLAVIPLFDGRQNECLNNWGGQLSKGDAQAIGLLDKQTHSGKRTVYIELGPLKAGESRYIQCFASGSAAEPQTRQTRDLTPYRTIEFFVKNTTNVPLKGLLKLKDLRNSSDQCAIYGYDLPQSDGWLRVVVPLDITAAGWTERGRPDFTRIMSIDFVFQPQMQIESGRVYVDNIVLIERAGPIDIDSSPLAELVERLARRQWEALWAARHRASGLMPINSYHSAFAGLNTTAAMLWMLPSAARRNWITREQADSYAELLVETINNLFAHVKYLPPRYVDLENLGLSPLAEESSIDAAFLALALHQYKSLSSISPSLRQALDDTENRFDFAAFACPQGWRMAYHHATTYNQEGFTASIYDGYTNESSLISLAAHLSQKHHLPIEAHWNTSQKRLYADSGARNTPLVHSSSEYRAPFTQALWNLFVDVRTRGVDCYPDGSLAVNPWQNFIFYEQAVMNRLAALGRQYLVQPDAGDDGTLSCYQQFSLYNDFGQSDLFMPWSASFALLAGVDGAEQSLRFLLRHRLYDPFGLSDSAKWATGAPEPYEVTARHDLWNTSLSTMAMLEWLDGQSRLSKSFADLPEVSAALDRVFLAAPANNAFPQSAKAP